VRLAARKERVRLHVPGARAELTAANPSFERGATFGSDLEVVVEHDCLAVEHEPEAVVRLREFEHGVDRVDEMATEVFERAVPLAIPVEVRNEKDLALGHTSIT
jgi:hypothetical protein